MNWQKLRRDLAEEARGYLADLRDIRDGLKSAEGWIALGLTLASLLMAAVWVVVSLGFNPPNDHVTAFVYKIGLRPCKPVDNFSGVVMFIDMILLFFLMVVSFGNVFNMMRRVNEGRPREPRDLIISTVLMLFVGVGGIFFMLWAC
jgi:hypothetical protein